MSIRRWLPLAFAISLPLAWGQDPYFTFSYRSPDQTSLVPVGPNGTITFTSTIVGQRNSISFIAENKDAASAAISDVALTASAFTVSAPGPEISVAAGASVVLTLTFSPVAAGPVSGTLSLRVANRTGALFLRFFLGGTGLAPDFITSYTLPGGNQIALADNARISFPATGLGETTGATVVIANRGTAAGRVSGVTFTAPDGFAISGLPLLPADVEPKTDLRFVISFTPKARQAYTGSLRIDFANTTLHIGLDGAGVAPVWSYAYRLGADLKPVASSEALPLPDAKVGQSTSAILRVTNAGDTEGTVAVVGVSGDVFAVSEAPALPVKLAPQAWIELTIRFAPKEPGAAAGKLRIDAATINLSGTGLGPKLSFLAGIASPPAPVAPGGTVNLPNTPVGGKSVARIQVANGGNLAATVYNVSVTGSGFALVAQPALPATLDPGNTLNFEVAFAPATLGAATATVQVDDQAITLRGIGDAPAAVSDVAFTWSGTLAPLQQPSIGLRLSAPYPLDISGKVALSFASDSFVDDPAIQFATGGRTADFRIPANTTDAIFGQGANQVQLQTGTVAGTIRVEASLGTGTVNLTPNPPPAKTFAVTAAEPTVRSVQLNSRGSADFELLLTGYTTTRSLTQLTFRFTPAPNANLQTTSLVAPVQTSFDAWFQSSSSYPYGGQFSAVVRFNVSGDLNAVQSVEVVAANAKGTSLPVSVSLR